MAKATQYKNHQIGSRKGLLHEAWDKTGAVGVIRAAARLGFSERSARTYISEFARIDNAGKASKTGKAVKPVKADKTTKAVKPGKTTKTAKPVKAVKPGKAAKTAKTDKAGKKAAPGGKKAAPARAKTAGAGKVPAKAKASVRASKPAKRVPVASDHASL